MFIPRAVALGFGLPNILLFIGDPGWIRTSDLSLEGIG
jgi:hypothetical protein